MPRAPRRPGANDGAPVAFRFVHTADLHLDSPLRTLAMRDRDLAANVDLATREAFVRIVDHCLDEGVDALMVAGDLTDGTNTSMKTAHFLTRQLARLSERGIQSFIVKGNHDARAPLTRGADWPEGVHLFDGRGGAGVRAREGDATRPPVVVHGVSFRNEHAPDSLLPRYAAPSEGAIDIALMHTSLAGSPGHDAYAPCALGDLVGHGFAYWGLGHVHSRSVHHEAGDCAVVMSGMPQGRDVGEAGPKSASLVTIADDGTVSLDTLPTAGIEFARERVELTAGMGWNDALEATMDALAAAPSRTAAPQLAARVELVGESREAWRLRRDVDAFAEELGERLPGGSGVAVETVRCRVERPGAAVTAGAGGLPLDELAALMREVAGETAFVGRARAVAHKVRGKLPARPRALRDGVLGPREEGEADRLAALIAHGVEEITARFEGAGRAADLEGGDAR